MALSIPDRLELVRIASSCQVFEVLGVLVELCAAKSRRFGGAAGEFWRRSTADLADLEEFYRAEEAP